MSKPSVDTSPMGTNGTASTTIPEPVDVIVHLMPDCVHVKRPLSSPLFPSNVVQPSSRSFCVFVLGSRRVFRNNQKKDPQLVYSTIPQVEIAIRIFSIFRSIRIREIVTRITSWEHMSFLIVDGTVVLFPFAFWLILVFIMERCGLGLECYVMFGYCKYHFLLYKKEAFYLTMTRNSVL